MKPAFWKSLSFGLLVVMTPLAFCGISIWMMMWRSVGLRPGESCAQSYHPVSKGIFWDQGEWHHYVDFTVDIDDPENYRWRIVHAPMPSSFQNRFHQAHTLRVTYRWPSDWNSPFSLSSWTICMLN